jgi:ferrochelatase
MKTGILVVNLGTPDSNEEKDVARYLREFLMDGRVIDIPTWKRWLLVNLIIAPFRAKKVSKEYKKLWLKEGSPLLVYGQRFIDKLEKLYDSDDVKVALAMRYQNPSINKGLEELRAFGAQQIIVFPMFPQYASATTGSVAEKVMRITSTWNVIPSIHFVNSYHKDSSYINVFVEKVKTDMEKYQPDHVLFSYHGLPERQLGKANEGKAVYCKFPNCNCRKENGKNPYCYRNACFETSKLIAKESGLSDEQFTTSFQSRLGKSPWIQPYTDDKIADLRKQGVKNLLVVSPSFVADCLETTLEIGEQYRDLFLELGGESFNYTTSLNDEDQWIRAVQQIIKLHTGFFNHPVTHDENLEIDRTAVR